jgi:hypothetical protein
LGAVPAPTDALLAQIYDFLPGETYFTGGWGHLRDEPNARNSEDKAQVADLFG